MMNIYYSFIGTLLAFAFRDFLETVLDLWKIKKIIKEQQAPEQPKRNLPKPKTANKSRVQR